MRQRAPDALQDFGGRAVPEVLVEIHTGEGGFLLGAFDVAEVLVELDIVGLLGIDQGSAVEPKAISCWVILVRRSASPIQPRPCWF